jgi:putative membrane protein
MFTAAIASFLHLYGLVLAGMCVVARWWFLRFDDEENLKRVLLADWVSLIAATLFMGSGLWRLFGGLEKPTDFYLDHPLFWLKMVLFGLMWIAEIPMMVEFIRWRIRLADDKPIEATAELRERYRHHHVVETALFAATMLCAALMAHGVGTPTPLPKGDGLMCAVKVVTQTKCTSCHAGAGAQGGLDLADPYAALVGVTSSQFASEQLVAPGNTEASLLYRKVMGTQGSLGAQMPMGGLLTDHEQAAIRTWIDAGAADDCR